MQQFIQVFRYGRNLWPYYVGITVFAVLMSATALLSPFLDVRHGARRHVPERLEQAAFSGPYFAYDVHEFSVMKCERCFVKNDVLLSADVDTFHIEQDVFFHDD